jgi:hypothetical protein
MIRSVCLAAKYWSSLLTTPSMTHLNRELALRAHIRNLLLDYALTHLTTDYLKFTEDAVYQVWFRHTVPPHYF